MYGIEIYPERLEIVTDNQTLQLSSKELHLFIFLLQNFDKYVKLWELQCVLSNNQEEIKLQTVNMLIMNLRKKLLNLSRKIEVKSRRKIGYRILISDHE
ncbi:winged helix-turn-helix domain-containing protein [Paenibacillus sp. Cedars]